MASPGVIEDVNALGARDPNERRRLTFGVGFRAVAMALLKDEKPDDADMILLYLAIVDAAMAGDSEILNCVPAVVERLERYMPGDEKAPWTAQWRGRIWGLHTAAVLSAALLKDERRVKAEE